MDKIAQTRATEMGQCSEIPVTGKVISLLEGGYDTAPETLGLARCVNAHVKALRGIHSSKSTQQKGHRLSSR